MAIDLVIFDCDGVLVDSEALACRVDLEELTADGITTLSLEEIIRRFSGVPQMEMVREIEQETGLKVRPDFASRVQSRVEELMRSSLQAMPGADTALSEIRLSKCVASSSAPSKLDLALTVSGLKRHFDPHIFSAHAVDRGKPAPDLFLHAAERMGVAPSRCCVVEDSIAGVSAGIAAGMKVIGFVGGSHCLGGQADVLRALGAEIVVDHWTSLSKVVGALRQSA
jgi:HAD superfamily hydrolase (TIGR01509 family)